MIGDCISLISSKTSYDKMDVSRIIGFLVVLVVKNLPANARDTGDSGSIPGLGRTFGIPANLFPQS